MKRRWLALLVATLGLCFLLPVGRAEALTGTRLINFDDVVAPGTFDSTTALRDAYLAQGVKFRGPDSNDGGAILTAGSFGVSGHSSPNVLAFNVNATNADGGIPRPPEKIKFTQAVTKVRILAGSNSSAGEKVRMIAFSGTGAIVDRDSLILASALAPLRVVGPGIRRVLIKTSAEAFVLDDLKFRFQ